MSDGRVSSMSRWHVARAIIAVLITIPLMLPLASSSTSRASTFREDQAPTYNVANIAPVDLPYAQGQGQGPDLCALLKEVAGSEPVNQAPGVGKPGADYQCTMAMRHGAYMTLTNFGVEQARVHVNLDKGRSGGWVPNALGDPGYGYESPASFNPDPYLGWSSITLIFARGCYFVQASGGKDPDTKKPSEEPAIPALASALDSALQQPPYSDCGGGPPQSGLDLTIDHMEVVQVIQTQGNNIPLVAGKKTVVRVFPRASGEAPGGVVSNVRGSLFFWPEGGKEVELKAAGNGTVHLVPGAEPEREKTEGSLNFVIPPEQAATGAFSLRAAVNPGNIIEEKSYKNNELVEPFEFIQRNGLSVGYVRIGYMPPFESTFSWPKADLSKYDPLLRKLLPAPEAGVQYYELPWRVRHTRSASTEGLGQDLLLYLREFYEQMQSDKPDILIGWLDEKYAKDFEYGGLAETATPGQLGRVAIVLDYQGPYSEETLAHEVGHDLGLKHTATTGDSNPPCRLSYNGDPGYWPSEYNNSAKIREVGFDTGSMSVVPSSRYEIMSYCSPNPWITAFHYRTLFDQNVKPAQEYEDSTVDKVLVRGWGWLRGGGGAPRFELVRPPDDKSGGHALPTLSGSDRASNSFGLHFTGNLLFAGAPRRVAFQSEGTGNYCLRFLDANGGALYERCFEPSFVNQESLEPIEETGFVLSVPDPGAFVRVALIQKDGGSEREITALEASAPPAVTITSPKAGDRWEGENTINWSGTDADGDELRYDIQYSPDGKKTWYPLEVRSYETNYTFSTDEILPSDQTYIRVMASDGFDTSHADVGPLVVPKQPNSPEPPPLSPGSETVTGPGTIVSPAGAPDLSLLYILGGGALLVIAAAIGMFFVMGVGRRRVAVPVAPPHGAAHYPTAPSYSPQGSPQQHAPQQGYVQTPPQPLPRRGSRVPLLLFPLLVIVGGGVAAGFIVGWKLPVIGGNSSSSTGGTTQPTIVRGGSDTRQYLVSLDDLPVGEPVIKDALDGPGGLVQFLRLEARPYDDRNGNGASTQPVAIQIALQDGQNKTGTEMWLVTSQELVDNAHQLVSGTSSSKVELAQVGKNYELASPEGWLLKVTVNSLSLEGNAGLTDGSQSPHTVFKELNLEVEVTPK
ncbi:MAG TPA: hypothetical protein VEX13_02355 [Chloroflexia bacterium]|nr:hypothetical protein [Chloroflexia bacterium]